MKKDVKEKRHLPAPLRDAGVVTYIQPHLIWGGSVAEAEHPLGK